MKVIANNRKAFHEYEILDKYEAGIELIGSEVKSIRMGRVNLKDSFVKIIKGEIFWLEGHISYLETVNNNFKPDEKRARKLLLHRKEIDKLFGKVSRDGLAITVLNLHLNKKNMMKLTIALAKGKNEQDKRQTIKKRIMDREAKASLKDY